VQLAVSRRRARWALKQGWARTGPPSRSPLSLLLVSRLPAESMSIKPTSELPSFVLAKERPKSGCLMRTLAKSCFFNMSRGGSRNTRLRPDYRLNERGIVRSTRQKGGSRALRWWDHRASAGSHQTGLVWKTFRTRPCALYDRFACLLVCVTLYIVYYV